MKSSFSTTWCCVAIVATKGGRATVPVRIADSDSGTTEGCTQTMTDMCWIQPKQINREFKGCEILYLASWLINCSVRVWVEQKRKKNINNKKEENFFLHFQNLGLSFNIIFLVGVRKSNLDREDKWSLSRAELKWDFFLFFHTGFRIQLQLLSETNPFCLKYIG